MEAYSEQRQGVAGQQLDIIGAMLAHLQWKQRLQGYISGSGEEAFDAQRVACDRSCTLGHWIHGEGGELHGEAQKFIALKTAHADFHRHAAEVILAVQRDERDAAQRMLSQGEYARCSNRIKSMLAGLSLTLDFT